MSTFPPTKYILCKSDHNCSNKPRHGALKIALHNNFIDERFFPHTKYTQCNWNNKILTLTNQIMGSKNIDLYNNCHDEYFPAHKVHIAQIK